MISSHIECSDKTMGNRVKERGGVDELISHLAQLTAISIAKRLINEGR